MIEHVTVSYAQNREDLILEGFFPDVDAGVYVDVGANHPIKDSVTKRFYMRGWRGINIEPNAALCRLLEFDRPEDANLNIGVSNKPGTLTFTEYANHGLSTFSSEMRDSYKGVKSVFTDTFREYSVPVKTLQDIFSEQKVKHIHFMKVDVEGFEYEVLEANDWKKFKPDMLCIESNHIVRDWRPLLKKQGYTKVFFDGLNDYYLAAEAMHRAKLFNYPKKILESGTILLLPVKQEFDFLQKQAELSAEQTRRKDIEKQQAEVKAAWYEERASVGWMARKTAKVLFRAIDKRMTAVPYDAAEYSPRTVKIASKATKQAVAELGESYKGSVHYRTVAPSAVQRAILFVPWMTYRVARKMVKLAKAGA